MYKAHGLRLLNLVSGEYLAIFGDGPIGLLALELAKPCFGVKKIAVIGATHHRLAKAKEMGADCVIDATKANVEVILRELGEGKLPDAVLEATNSNVSQQNAVIHVRYDLVLCFSNILLN